MFVRDGVLHRQVTIGYRENYDHCVTSGLYEALFAKGLLIPHVEASIHGETESAYRVITPEIIPFISYPYEWPFTALKRAALLTLEVQRVALEFGMSLKDATAYNVQFRGTRPVFIDSLSFERYCERPWVGYRQFCSHFLAPLALMTYGSPHLNQMLARMLDGVPLDVATSLLPWRSWANPALALHLHLHARSYRRSSPLTPDKKSTFSRTALLGLMHSLERAVDGLKPPTGSGGWSDYPESSSYSPDAWNHKVRVVGDMLEHSQARSVWDLGANRGVFSRIAAAPNRTVIA